MITSNAVAPSHFYRNVYIPVVYSGQSLSNLDVESFDSTVQGNSSLSSPIVDSVDISAEARQLLNESL